MTRRLVAGAATEQKRTQRAMSSSWRLEPRDRTSWIVGFPGAKSGGARLCTLRIAASLAALRVSSGRAKIRALDRAPAPSTSDSVGRLLAGTSKAIGKRRQPASQRAVDQLFTLSTNVVFVLTDLLAAIVQSSPDLIMRVPNPAW
jgi:hypothetical protein